MVEWSRRTRRTRNPGGDPRGVADDGGAVRLRHRPELSAVTPQRRSYAYRVASPAGVTLQAAALSSGAGGVIDLPPTLAALTWFLLADAGRYDHRHGGEVADAKRAGEDLRARVADLREHLEVPR